MRFGEDDKAALEAGPFKLDAGPVTHNNPHDPRSYVGVSATHIPTGYNHAVSSSVRGDDEEGALLACYASLADWMRMKGFLDG